MSKKLQAMTNGELVIRYTEILDKFDEYSESDPFGWDWPTMFGVFPELVTEARAIGAEAKARGERAKALVSQF